MPEVDDMKRTASLLIAGALACSSPASEERQANPIEQPAVALRIATVNYPLAWMASRLLPSAEVLFPAPTGIDPAYWQPDSQTISGVYQAADIIALNGDVLQSVSFHTSCSQPLKFGDQFGANMLIGFEPEQR